MPIPDMPASSQKEVPELRKAVLKQQNEVGQQNEAEEQNGVEQPNEVERWNKVEQGGAEARNASYTFPFLRLPKEIRLLVLKYSDLVDSRFGSWYQQPLLYKHGRLKVPGLHANFSCHTSETSCDFCPHIMSGSLLRVNKQLHDEAFEVLITSNLLILNSGHVKNLEFLQSLSPLIRNRIQHLDLKFNYDFDFADGEDFWCCFFWNFPDFDRLINYISNNLRLEQLHLTLDMLAIYDDVFWGNAYCTPAIAALWLRALKRISKPLPKLRGLQKFHVFSAVHAEYEHIMEQVAMGPDYDSHQDGKVPLEDRDSHACHAFPFDQRPKSRNEIEDATLALEFQNDNAEVLAETCSHPEWYTGIPIPPVPSRPPPGQGWRDVGWYGQRARMEALEMTQRDYEPGKVEG